MARRYRPGPFAEVQSMVPSGRLLPPATRTQVITGRTVDNPWIVPGAELLPSPMTAPSAGGPQVSHDPGEPAHRPLTVLARTPSRVLVRARDAAGGTDVQAYLVDFVGYQGHFHLPATVPTELGVIQAGGSDGATVHFAISAPVMPDGVSLQPGQTFPVTMRVAAVDGVLGQLADDADFQSDLKRPTVRKAINHWTNRARLQGPEAQELFGDASPEAPRLRSVLAKISRLSAACKAAGMPVPIDRVLAARRVAFDPPAPKTKEAPALDEYGLPPLPPPTPFSWRRFLLQLAVQMSCLLVSLVIVKTWIEPRLLRQLDERMAAERAELDPASEVVYSEEEEWAAEPDLL